MATIHFAGSRAKILEKALQLARILAGKAPDPHNLGRGFLLTLGMAALSDIREAYLVKASGGTDAMGIKWPPLKPATIAARRVGPRDRKNPDVKSRLDAEKEAAQRIRRSFTERKDKIRKQRKDLVARFSFSLSKPDARKRADEIIKARIARIDDEKKRANISQRAKLLVTRESGQKRVDVFGARDVEILRDTGIMLNSLSPGVLVGAGATLNYNKPTMDGGDLQILETQRGTVIVGTNVPYAEKHQTGDPSTNLPQRKFLPEDDQDVPPQWWDNWTEAARDAVDAAATIHFGSQA